MESIKVNPCCANDEDFEMEWFEGYHGFHIEEQEAEFDFFERINGAVENHFQKALTEVEPLLRSITIKQINLVSDYSGVLSLDGAIASWWYGRSQTVDGHYTIVASPRMINACLHLMDNPDHELGGTISTTWHHELIHLADQKAILRSGNWHKAGSDRMVRRKYLSKYREEGIAELWYVGKGHSKAREIENGREYFSKDLTRIAGIVSMGHKDRKSYSREVLNSNSYYYAGPWMVLHALSCSSCTIIATIVCVAIEKIAQGELLSNEELFDLINASVNMDVETFMEALERPGYDGKAFANLRILEDAIAFKQHSSNVTEFELKRA